MANRPPSSCTIGRSSGGITGTASRIIISGLLPELMNAETTFSRLTARACFWPLAVLTCSWRSADSAVEVDLLEQVAHRLGAHAAAEVLAEAVRGAEPVLELAERGLVVDDVLGLHRLEQLPHLTHPLGGVLDVGLGVVDVGLEALAEVLEHLLALLVGELRDVDLERLGPQVVLVGEVAADLGRSRGTARGGERLLQLEDALLLLGRVGVEHLVDLALERFEVARAGLVVDPRRPSTRRSTGPSRAPSEPCRAGSRSGSGRP